MSDEPTLDVEHAREFLRGTYLDLDGYLSIGMFEPKKRWKFFPTTAEGIDAAVKEASWMESAYRPKGIYFRVTTVREPLPNGQRGSDEHSLAVPMLWGDVDYGTEGHASTRLPPHGVAAEAMIQASGLPAPTLMIHTGGGLDPLWVFAPDARPAPDAASKLCEGVQHALAEAHTRHGFGYGNVGDLSRVLRLPGSINRKTDEPRPCFARVVSGELVTADQFPVYEEPKKEPPRSAGSSGGGTGVFATLAETASWTDLLQPAGWVFVKAEPSGAQLWRRPGDGVASQYSARCFEFNVVVHSTEADLPSGKGKKLSKGRLFAWLWHDGDESAASRDLIAAAYGTGSDAARSLPEEVLAAIRGSGATAPENAATPVTTLPNLPEEFWSARPVLEHIRAAAHARNRSADAVLHAVLARLAARMPHTVRVETGVGSPAVLNYFVCLVGPSSAGKSGSAGIARSLIPAPMAPKLPLTTAAPESPMFADDVPLGTGEGIAEAYMGVVTQVDAKGKPTQVRAKVRSNAFIYGDEGEALVKLLERGGATIGETLRRAWNAETIGQRNGSAERTRIIPRGTYSLGVAIGFQPETIGPLLDDAAAGTPQRFLYASAIDPSVPEVAPESPGELAIAYPGTTSYPVTHDLLAGVSGAIYLGIDRGVCAEIRRIDRAKIVGQLQPAPLDGHEQLTRVKVSGLLAVLDGRAAITAEDWELSGVIWRTSCGVRDALVNRQRHEAIERERVATKKHVARHEAVAESEDDRALHSACRSVGRRVHSHAPTHPEGSCPRRCVTQAISGKHRQLVTVDQVIERVVGAGVVEQTGDERFRAGSVQP